MSTYTPIHPLVLTLNLNLPLPFTLAIAPALATARKRTRTRTRTRATAHAHADAHTPGRTIHKLENTHMPCKDVCTWLYGRWCLLVPYPPGFFRRHYALSSAFRRAARDVPLLVFALAANTQCNACVP